MIREKSRNLSASWAASCANQMFLNVVLRRTARKPPGLSTSNLKGSALKGSAIAGAILARESVIQVLPFSKAEGLGAALRVDLGSPQTRCCGFATDARDPPKRAAELLAAELKHRFHEAEERVNVSDVDRRPAAHVEHHESRVDARLGREGGRRDGELQACFCKDLDRHRRQAGAGARGPTFCDLLLHHQRQAPRPWRPVENFANERACEVVGDVADDHPFPIDVALAEVELENVRLDHLDPMATLNHLSQRGDQCSIDLDSG